MRRTHFGPGVAWADDRPRTTVTLQPLSLISGYIDLEVEPKRGRGG